MRSRGLTESLFTSPARVAVLRQLAKAPDLESTGSGLARAAGISTPWTLKALEDLRRMGLVELRRVPPSDLWRPNKDHVLWPEISRVLSLDERMFELILEGVRRVVAGPGVVKAFVYGSAARRDGKPQSDVDVMVVLRDEKARMALEKRLEKADSVFVKKFGNPLHVIAYTEPEWRRKQALPLVKAVLKEGILIVGAPS
jgi:predicted nucleotidyltransferase